MGGGALPYTAERPRNEPDGIMHGPGGPADPLPHAGVTAVAVLDSTCRQLLPQQALWSHDRSITTVGIDHDRSRVLLMLLPWL
jgi:hypothetical protein